MTVNSSVSSASSIGDGVSTVFPVPFYFLADNHLKLISIGTNNAESDLVLNTDYSVQGAGIQAGGSVTMLNGAPAPGVRILIFRSVPIDQQVDYTPNDKFPAQVTEGAFDKLTMIAQELQTNQDASIRYPLSEFGTDGTLPSAAARAGTVLGFDDSGTIKFLPIPPNVGAGDLRNEVFVDGVDYTAGTSTTLTLSRLYTTKANLGSVVMQGVAQDPRSYQLSGLQLTFDAVIPLGVSSIWLTGGTTLSVDSNTAGKVAMSANGVDDTRSFQLACLVAQEIEFVGTGPFFLGPVTVPSSVKSWFSKSGAVVKPSGAVPVGANFSTWITASGLSDAKIGGLEFQAPSATYSGLISPGNYGGLTVLSLANCRYTVVDRVVTNGSGYTGISSALGIGNKILNCRAIDWLGNGIKASGSSLAALDLGTEISGCYSEGNGASSIAHGVVVLFGIDFNIHHNRAKNAGTFGFAAALCEGGVMGANQSYNSIHEGLNVEDSNHVKVFGNEVRWDAGGGPGIDFGMSFFGNTRNCIGLEVIGNKVLNSASSGIAFAGSASFGLQHSPVRDNFVFNCNAKQAAVAGGVDNLAGIMLSATLTQSNPIAGNTVVDTVGTLTYGIAELNFGTGFPSSNEITSNRTFGAFTAGAPIHANNASTKTALNTSQL
jgi:hypothetical protein